MVGSDFTLLKMIAWEKHSSLFVCSVTDDEKKVFLRSDQDFLGEQILNIFIVVDVFVALDVIDDVARRHGDVEVGVVRLNVAVQRRLVPSALLFRRRLVILETVVLLLLL